jgi:molybdenum cofactor cytidylyltransferase
MTPPAAAPVDVSGIVLAAGSSRRFGSTKQLAAVGGRPLVRVAVECACASRLAEVLVVVGHEGKAVSAAVAGLPVRVVFNPDFADGQSTSVRAGLARASPASRGAMFIPGDQPGLTPSVIDDLIRAFVREPETIAVPTYGGRRGAPVLFPRELFGELDALRGDTGGRALLAQYSARVREVAFLDTLPSWDLDTPADRDAWLARQGRGPS